MFILVSVLNSKRSRLIDPPTLDSLNKQLRACKKCVSLMTTSHGVFVLIHFCLFSFLFDSNGKVEVVLRSYFTINATSNSTEELEKLANDISNGRLGNLPVEPSLFNSTYIRA